MATGSLCMAPFSEDGRWCRARVKGGPRTLTDGDGVLLVEYVDFGSCYEHRPSELRAIPVELLEFPVQTVQVRLWGLSPPPCVDPASAAAAAGERLPYGPEWPHCTLIAVRSCVDGVPLVASTVDRAASRDDAQRGGGVTSMLKQGGFFCFEGRRNSRRPLAPHAGVQ
ncbi:unnamed protein product [Lampetra planeri]